AWGGRVPRVSVLRGPGPVRAGAAPASQPALTARRRAQGNGAAAKQLQAQDDRGAQRLGVRSEAGSGRCAYYTQHLPKMKEHVSSSHRVKAAEHKTRLLWKECTLQTYFTRKGQIDYFVVVDNSKKGEKSNAQELSAPLKREETALFTKLEEDYQKGVRRDIEEQASTMHDFADSRSERVPWLERGSYKLPPKKEVEGRAKGATDPNLARILAAAKAMLRDAYELASGKADRFQHFKNPSTLVKYFTTIKQLLVYYYRVVHYEGGHFTQATPGQAIDKIVAALAIEDTGEAEQALKHAIWRLYLALICHIEGQGGLQAGPGIVGGAGELQQPPICPNGALAALGRAAARGEGPNPDGVVEAEGRPGPRGLRGLANDKLSACLAKACTRTQVPRFKTARWRQIAASITKEKFATKEQANFDVEDSVGDDVEDKLDLVALAELTQQARASADHPQVDEPAEHLVHGPAAHRGRHASRGSGQASGPAQVPNARAAGDCGDERPRDRVQLPVRAVGRARQRALEAVGLLVGVRASRAGQQPGVLDRAPAVDLVPRRRSRLAVVHAGQGGGVRRVRHRVDRGLAGRRAVWAKEGGGGGAGGVHRACRGAATGPGAGQGARGLREGPQGDERELHVLPGAGAEGKGRGARGAEEGGQGVDQAVPSLLEVLLAAGDMLGGRPRAQGGTSSTLCNTMRPAKKSTSLGLSSYWHYSIQALRLVLLVLVGVQVVRAADLAVDDSAMLGAA
ncbi:hypothetical protein V492_00706, partial [Pseudogymnoascus sp. VKM F-4246]